MSRKKKKPDALFVRTFAVVGSGEFPLDMLRYDRAWPADEHAAMWAAAAGDRRVVRLTMATGVDRGPTPDRWASFGWTVVESVTSGLAGAVDHVPAEVDWPVRIDARRARP